MSGSDSGHSSGRNTFLFPMRRKEKEEKRSTQSALAIRHFRFLLFTTFYFTIISNGLMRGMNISISAGKKRRKRATASDDYYDYEKDDEYDTTNGTGESGRPDWLRLSMVD